MGFMPRRAIRRPPPLSFIVAIGQHVFVNCRTGAERSVLLGDEGGKVMSTTSLADGVEVEVMAWRPRGPTDTRYRVRAGHGAIIADVAHYAGGTRHANGTAVALGVMPSQLRFFVG